MPDLKTTIHLAEVALVALGADVADGEEIQTAQLDGWVFALDATIGTGTALDVKVQDSFDEGVTWFDVPLAANPNAASGGDFAQATGDDQQVLAPIRPLGPRIRALRTSTGNGWSYTLKACCDIIR